jgi:hypothetical protein
MKNENYFMKDEKYSLAKLALVSIVVFVVTIFSIDSTSYGFHIYDTFFIINKLAKYSMLATISVFIGSLFASIFTLFKNKFFVKMLVFSLLLLVSGGMYIFAMFGYDR